MVDVIQKTLDGELLLAFPRIDRERKRKRKWWHKNRTAYRAAYKLKALLRVVEAWNDLAPVCHICGCPHIEALTFGHPDRNGTKHREYITKTASEKSHRRTPRRTKTPSRKKNKSNTGGHGFTVWVKNATLEEIRKWNVRLECTYCNFYESINGHYPEPDKRPQWEMIDRV